MARANSALASRLSSTELSVQALLEENLALRRENMQLKQLSVQVQTIKSSITPQLQQLLELVNQLPAERVGVDDKNAFAPNPPASLDTWTANPFLTDGPDNHKPLTGPVIEPYTPVLDSFDMAMIQESDSCIPEEDESEFSPYKTFTDNETLQQTVLDPGSEEKNLIRRSTRSFSPIKDIPSTNSASMSNSNPIYSSPILPPQRVLAVKNANIVSQKSPSKKAASDPAKALKSPNKLEISDSPTSLPMRPRRRTSAQVNYTMPSLRSKMRRQVDGLANAVVEKPKDGSTEVVEDSSDDFEQKADIDKKFNLDIGVNVDNITSREPLTDPNESPNDAPINSSRKRRRSGRIDEVVNFKSEIDPKEISRRKSTGAPDRTAMTIKKCGRRSLVS